MGQGQGSLTAGPPLCSISLQGASMLKAIFPPHSKKNAKGGVLRGWVLLGESDISDASLPRKICTCTQFCMCIFYVLRGAIWVLDGIIRP